MPVNNSSSNFKCFLVHFNNHEAASKETHIIVDTCQLRRSCVMFIRKEMLLAFSWYYSWTFAYGGYTNVTNVFLSNYILFSIMEYETVPSGNLQQELRSKTPVTSRVIKMHSEPGQGLSGWKTPVGLKHVFFYLHPFSGKKISNLMYMCCRWVVIFILHITYQ